MTYSDYLENKILDHLFGKTTYTAPATLYVGLCASVNDAGTITGEPSGNGYARVAVTNNTTNWPDAASGTKSNGTEIAFPQASGTWGSVGYFFLADDPTAGNLIAWGELTGGAVSPVNEDTPKFAVGAIEIVQS